MLDAYVDDRVAVVGQDDVDKVLADVMHVALDGGKNHGALARLVGLVHVRLKEGNRGLHDLCTLKYERQLHLAGSEEVTYDLHATQQGVIHDLKGGSFEQC